MKILIISHEYPPIGGGGANACQALSLEFVRGGHQVHILTAGFGDTPLREEICGGQMIISRVKAKRVSRNHCSAAEMFDYIWKASTEAKSILGNEKFDICLCFFGIPGGVLARMLKHRHGLRYVIRMGGGDIPGFQDRFRQLYKLVSPELRRIWRDAEMLVTNSEGLRQMAKGFCDSYPIRVIPNGVDTEIYQPNEQKFYSEQTLQDDGTVKLLSVCRLIRRKGLQDVLPVIKDIEKRSGRDILWTIAGDGPYRGELEGICRDAGAEDNVRFIGQVERTALPSLYQEADIFVFPSLREGMPNAVLEAMASGLPVVMREECQGAAELVRDNGMIATGDFTEALYELIAAGKDKWKEMGDASRRIVLEDYTWKSVSEKYIELLEQAMADKDLQREEQS